MATTLNLTLEQGATFSQAVTVAAAAATTYDAYTARATVRRYFGGPILATLSCSAISTGVTTLSLTAAQTAELLAPAWCKTDERLVDYGVWDLELVSGATVVRSMQGVVKLSREATT